MASGEPRTRQHTDPYLSSLSGDAAERVTIMKWARYLGATFGTTGALRALQYYRDVNWIGDSVKRTMTEYVRGLPIEDLDREEDTDPSLTDALASLEGTHFEEHAKSLEFIAAIADNNIEHSLASLQLTENGSLGMAGMGGDLGDRSEDLFTAPGFGATERAPGASESAGSPDIAGRSRRSTGVDANGPDPSPDRSPDRSRRDTTRDSSVERSPSQDSTRETPSTEPESRRSNDRATPPHSDPSPDEPEAGKGGSPATPGDGNSPATPDDGAIPASDEASHGADSPSIDDGTAADSPSGERSGSENRPTSSEQDSHPDPDESSSREVPSDPGETPSNGVSGAANDATGMGGAEAAGTDEAEGATEADAGTEADPDSTTDDDVPPDEDRCIALTRDGERCSRRAMEGRDYCKQHAP